VNIRDLDKFDFGWLGFGNLSGLSLNPTVVSFYHVKPERASPVYEQGCKNTCTSGK